MRRRLALSALVLLAACAPAQPGPARSVAPTPAATASAAQPTAVHSPTPTPRTLMAVLEAIGPGTRIAEPGVADSYDTVAIAGTDGFAVAKTTFTARTLPVVGNAGPVPGLPAVVAGNAVFFSDRQGVIRRLDVSGRVTTAATFPVTTSQQVLRFAVSPDGQHLMGSVLTFPDVNPAMTNPGDVFVPGSHFHLALYSATAGGVATRLYDRDLGDRQDGTTMMAGWDATGPLATVNSALGTQQGTGGPRVYGGPLARVNPDGSLGNSVGGIGCSAVDYQLDGTVVCGYDGHIAARVVGPDGVLKWSLDPCAQAAGGMWSGGRQLSADQGSVLLGEGVCRRDGTVLGYPRGAYPLGWLDDGTVVMWLDVNGHEMALWKPGTAGATDLGYKASFVGTIRG